MTRFLLSAVSICVLLLTTFLLPQSVSARRCMSQMPLTLLTLYRTSDSILVGKYEKSVEGETTEDNPDFSIVPIKKHYSIASALKGETMKMLTIDDREYRYKNHEGQQDESDLDETDEVDHTEPGEAVGDDNEIKPGDQVLIFVVKNKETGVVELSESYDRIKKMTSDKLSSYESRIRELNGIFSAEKPSRAEVVNWLIRCAEDPHTRWEGTYELLRSFQNMDWQEEREKAAKEVEADMSDESEEHILVEVPKDFETGDPKLARSVTEAQKSLLTRMLLDRKPMKGGETGGISMRQGDRELIELVARWGDPSVASNLLERLRSGSTDANLNSELMAAIAAVLKDDVLGELSAEFSDVQWELDEAEIQGRQTSEPAADGSDTNETDRPAENEAPPVLFEVVEKETANIEQVEESAGAASEREVVEPAAEKKKKKEKTYGELRSELLTKFVSRADIVMALERNKNTSKLN